MTDYQLIDFKICRALSTQRWIRLTENHDRIDQLIKTCDDKTDNNPGWSKCSRIDDDVIRERHR